MTMFKKILSLTVIACFFLTSLSPLPKAHADSALSLPTPGTMINLSPAYEPALIKGLTVHKDNPFLFDFIVDTGNSGIAGDKLKTEGDRLVKYFFACLTIPEKDLWVNLSPYEKTRMVPDALGQTALGRDLLAQDYILKQLTASLIYPEKDLGRAFWDRLYAKARQQYGTTQIPVNTFNKVWILADRAKVYEHGQTAFVMNGHLKVMLEEDYLSLNKHTVIARSEVTKQSLSVIPAEAGIQSGANALGSQIVREIVLPEIEKEVNTGKNFAALRQIFNSLVLATWYKNNLKEALLTQVYANKSTVKGVNLADPSVKEQIYQQYLQAYKKGVFNYIKEDTQADGQSMPRKYFSGGFGSALKVDVTRNAGMGAEIHMTRAYMMQTALGLNGFGPAQATDAAMNTAQVISLPKSRYIPGFHELEPGQLYLDKFAKLYTLAVNFLNLYGGDKPEYAILRELSRYAEQNNVDIRVVSKTVDPYVDINYRNKQIAINGDFLDFLFRTGRKKIYISFITAAILKLRNGRTTNTRDIELLVTGGKRSVIPGAVTRLDDTKKLYQLTQRVKANDTKEGATNPKFLNDDDVLLVISDVLHRGRILDARRLWEYLRNTYSYYGIRDISREKAGELLARFKDEHPDIVASHERVVKNDIEHLERKLEPVVKVLGESEQENGAETRTLVYTLKPDYIMDPAFKDRITIWDVEVERQDEVDFGGKVAHTGEMMFIPHIITLPNFSSSGATFQKLFEFNKIPDYLEFVKRQQTQLNLFMEEHSGQLDVLPKDVPEELEHELNALRIVIQDGDKEEDKVINQVRTSMAALNEVITDLESGSFQTLRDYFRFEGQKLDAEVERINKEREDLGHQISLVSDRIKILREQGNNTDSENSELDGLNENLRSVGTDFEKITAHTANKLLTAARFLMVDPKISDEIKSNLRILARRIGIPLNRLLLAIRSSAVGEDSEEASFAGRQDTYIFQHPIATKSDAEGLDNVIVSWIFNQASLFNKRAIDYRAEQGLPTFDEHVEISTLFQQMFLSEKSYIGFSVDRESGAPLISMSITEGQGELLVAGRENGSKFITTYDGTLLVRQKGDRRFQVVETRDSFNKQLIPIPERVRQEFAITDENVIKETAQYFKYLHDYYEGYIDTEGALRIMRDEAGQIMYLHDPKTGEILRDQRGLPRYPWMIVSTQVRPETVFSGQDSDIVPLKRIVVTDGAYRKAEEKGLVLDYDFIAKTMGTAQGDVVYIRNKSAESLGRAEGRIMITEQSDPDMTSAMQRARGVVAVQGGPNSHTMIVAAEYELVAMSGISGARLEDLEKKLPEGIKITIDAERGKLIIGTDHELAIAGKDFNVRDIPDTPYGGIRSSTIVASVNKAFRQSALSKIPSYKGIGLLRLELALAEIGIYPEYLLAYDNLKKKERGEAYSGPILDPVTDADGIKHVEKTIEGYNSAEDFYVSVISEWVTAMAETLVAPKQEVIVRAQSIQDPELRLAVLALVNHYYDIGLGHEEPLYELKKLLVQQVEKVHQQGQEAQPGSDIDILTKVIGLVDKRLYIRLDDRKSDEYGAVFGADMFVKEEQNPMKGYRGLDLMLRTPETLRWQLEALKKAAELRRSKMGIFAPVVRRPQDVRKLLAIMDEVGLTSKLVKRGIMTELPTNSINIADFLATGIDFISTGGNDGLQTVGRIDRNTSFDALKRAVTAYSLSILRWNAYIITGIKKFFSNTKKVVEAGFCGNDPSVKGQENYGVILAKLGYDSVSVVIDAFQAVATNLTRKDFQIPKEAEDAVGFDFKMNRNDLRSVRRADFETFDITKFRQNLSIHYRAFMEYSRLLNIIRETGALTEEKDREIYRTIRQYLISKGVDTELLNNPSGARIIYRNWLIQEMESEYRQAAQRGKQLIVALDNGFSYQYHQLPLGSLFEPHEPNADYGYQGLVRALDTDKDVLELELSAVQEVAKRHSNNGVTLLLRSVRSYKEIDSLRQFMREKSISLPFAVDVDVTANIFEIKEILEQKPDFVSVLNPRQLTSDMMALEQKNTNGLEITQDDVNYQLDRPTMILATASKEAGVPFYLDPSVHPTPMATDAAMTRVLTADQLFKMPEQEWPGAIETLVQNHPEFIKRLRSGLDDAKLAFGYNVKAAKALDILNSITRNEDRAALAQPGKPVGGIDLNSANMGMTVTRDANGGVQVHFDPAMIARIKAQGVFSADPFIIRITPMNPAQITPLLGLQNAGQPQSV
jgi:phosphoenolpyruvate synthase/pyruvate phosphate dikinase